MYQIRIGDKSFELKPNAQNPTDGTLNDREYTLDLRKTGEHNFHVIRDGFSYNVEVIAADPVAKTYTIRVNGESYTMEMQDELDLMLSRLGMQSGANTKINQIKAPMPGLVLHTRVEVGQEVKKDDPLLVLEAMKMENILKSPGEGVVAKIHVEKGQAVEKNQLLITFA